MPEEYSPETYREEPTLPPTIVTAPQEVMKEILDPSNIIEKIRHNLKGEIEVIDSLGKKRWDEKGAKIMNDDGINHIISILDSYINRNTLLSNLDDNEILMIIKPLDKELNALFYQKWRKFDLELEHWAITKNRIVDMVFLALKQANNKVLLDALTKAYSIREVKGFPERRKSVGEYFTGIFKK